MYTCPALPTLHFPHILHYSSSYSSFIHNSSSPTFLPSPLFSCLRPDISDWIRMINSPFIFFFIYLWWHFLYPRCIKISVAMAITISIVLCFLRYTLNLIQQHFMCNYDFFFFLLRILFFKFCQLLISRTTNSDANNATLLNPRVPRPC